MKVTLEPEEIAKIYNILTNLVVREKKDINDLDRIEIDEHVVSAFLRIENEKQ